MDWGLNVFFPCGSGVTRAHSFAIDSLVDINHQRVRNERVTGVSERRVMNQALGLLSEPLADAPPEALREAEDIVRFLGLDEVELVDAHAHAFDPQREVGGLARQFSLSSEEPLPGMIEKTVLFRTMLRELAAFLGCGPTIQEVANVRAAAYGTDPAGYVARLFNGARIGLVLIDTGYPSSGAGYEIDQDAFRRLLPCPVENIHRVEHTLDPLLDLEIPFTAVLRRFRDDVVHQLRNGAVGLKSSIAYRSGLDVEVVQQTAAERAHGRMRARRASNGDRKVVRDWFFAETLRIAIDHDVPVQVHTGMGDGPDFDMRAANPILLGRVFADRELRAARIVLIHAGYPWVEEAGWAANQFDNVYVDISEMNPFSAHGVTSKLLSLLEMTPTHKLMFGTDGINAPEVAWFAAVRGRRSVAACLGTLVRDDWLTASEAAQIGRDILADNARALYRLPIGNRIGGQPHG